MQEDEIAEIGIDDGQLWVRPSKVSFEYIYRAGMEVHWDSERERLFSPKPRKWTYLQWFDQIVAAAAAEYGVHLKLTSSTLWRNVSDELKAEVQGSSTSN
jgi:hypothetical protein